MTSLVPLLRAALMLVWLLSPLFLALIALWICRRTPNAKGWKAPAAIVVAAGIAGNWVLFIVFLIRSQTPYGGDFRTSLFTHSLLLLSCFGAIAPVALRPRNWLLSLGSLLLITLWVVIGYVPSHWLGKWNYGSVSIDGRPTAADIYIGQPTDSEAEAIVLVHIPGEADYFLSFGEEKVRVAARREYVRIPGGIWTLQSMRDMIFMEPLPSRQLNEFRMPSPKGGVVSVQF